MKPVVIIPALNEARSIGNVIAGIPRAGGCSSEDPGRPKQ